MKVLVTGSSGKLGKQVIHWLRAKHCETVGVDLMPSDTTDRVIDLTNSEELSGVFEGITHVVHTAALHGKHSDLQVPRGDFIQTNVLGTLNLLDLSASHGVRRFVYTSSTSIYGEALHAQDEAVWVDEELVPRPRDIYDITKQTAEELCRDFQRHERLKTLVLRVSRFMEESPNDLLNHRLSRGVDERDAARAHGLALAYDYRGFEIFNISAKSPFQKSELRDLKADPIQVILEHYPEVESSYSKHNWKFPTSIDRVYDISKAEDVMGYQPEHNFLELLQQLSRD